MTLTLKTGLRAGTGLLLLAAATLASPASAQTKTFDLTYSGASFGDAAVATGYVTIDESLLNNPGATEQINSPFVTAFSLTISGASSGNGTFTFADFNGSTQGPFNPSGGFFLDTHGGTLDLSQQLIGQPTTGDPYGTPSGNGGDFNVFENAAGVAAGAPTGSNFFTITTNNRNGDALQLTSFAPAPVPESSSTVSLGLMLALGLGGVAVARRRKSAA